MHLRPAVNGDTESIRQVVFTVLEEYGLVAEPQERDADLDDVEAGYIRPGGLFDVLVTDDDRIVGTMGLVPLREGVCELRKMYLLPEVRGHGWGKRMMEHVLDRARDLGFKRVELETAAVLVEAIGLYTRYGFTPMAPKETGSRCDQAMALDL